MSNGCFLCRPDPALVYYSTPEAYAMCGLGPLMPGYSVIAATEHVPSAADANGQDRNSLIHAVEVVRDALERRFESTLITEHGRVPVCVDSTRDLHCYHAHFLVFPGAPAVIDQASAAYRRREDFDSLDAALSGVPQDEEYMLVSSAAHVHTILLEPSRTYRQFARTLVAEALGVSELASWRLRPEHEQARQNAGSLRELFADA